MRREPVGRRMRASTTATAIGVSAFHNGTPDCFLGAAEGCGAVAGLVARVLMTYSLSGWSLAPGKHVYRYSKALRAILRRTNAICVASGSSFGHTSWQASSDMQPNTPSSSPMSS